MPNENIYIGFSTQKKWNPLSWAIKKCQGVSYSHVYVRFPSDRYKRDLVYQASELSVHFIGWDRFRDASKIIKEYSIPITPETKIKVMQYAIDNAGRPYGWAELFGFVWIILCRKFGKRVGNPMGDGAKTFVCSELAAAVLKELGYDAGANLDNLSPKDIDDFLASKKFPVRGGSWKATIL